MFIIVLGGLLMALADSVPGVSGGTMAFIMGIYDDFICSLNDIASKDKEKRKKSVIFLLKLAIGWITGMIMAVIIISNIFEKNIYEMSSLFMGFILASLPLIVMEEMETIRKSARSKYLNAVWLILGVMIVVLITYMSSHNLGGVSSLKWGEFSAVSGIYIFVVAALAISAMVLPGISGSTVMLIFGIYLAVIDGIKGFLGMDFSYLPGLIIFGLGVITGICSVVKLLRYLLEKHRAAIVFFILGMMLGSFYAIAKGAESLDEPKPAMSLSTFSPLWFAAGILFIVALQFIKVKISKKR